MPNLGQLIRKARGSASQKKFAAEIGTNQPLLSKYERNQVGHVPITIVERCMEIVEGLSRPKDPGVETVAARVREELAGEESADMRRTILRMLDCVRWSQEKAVPAGGRNSKRRPTTDSGSVR